MRQKFEMWADCAAPTRKHRMCASKRHTPRRSIGPKVLLAATLVVAAAIGVSGIDPQVIDTEWDEDASTQPSQMTLPTRNATTRRSGIVAAIPLPPPRVAITTGEATVSSPHLASSLEFPQLHTTVTAAAVEPAAETAAPPAVAEIPNAQAKAYAAPGHMGGMVNSTGR